MHLKYWIEKLYANETWKKNINDKRIRKAEQELERLKLNRQDFSLLDCTQICDKLDVLKKTTKFIKTFFESKGKFEKYGNNVVNIRDALVHCQNSIFSSIGLTNFIETVSKITKFLSESEDKSGQKIN